MRCSKQKVKWFSIWFRAVRRREKNRPEKKEMTEKFGEGLDAKMGENGEILGEGMR